VAVGEWAPAHRRRAHHERRDGAGIEPSTS
jgi:hypothetical protein